MNNQQWTPQVGEFVTFQDGKKIEKACVLSLGKSTQSKYGARLAIMPRAGDEGVFIIRVYKTVKLSPLVVRR
jgi:hypothetical protein